MNKEKRYMSKPLTIQAREAAAQVAKHSTTSDPNIWEIVLLGDVLTALACRHGLGDEASELIAKFVADQTPAEVAS